MIYPRSMDEWRCSAGDWRMRAYAGVSLAYWVLALGPGNGGAGDVQVEGTGAVINLVLGVAWWFGASWAFGLLLFEATLLTGVVLGGVLPSGPSWFSAVAVLSGLQLMLLGSWWAARTKRQLVDEMTDGIGRPGPGPPMPTHVSERR